MDTEARADADNSVFLRGTITVAPAFRSLAGGEEVLAFRVAVRRPGVGNRLDIIDCAARTPAASRAVQKWSTGDLVEVNGALHRRFWRSASGVASRCEVEVASARRANARRARA